MSPADALFHLLNFFAPAVAVGFLSALWAKLAWRRELRGVSWARLGAWAAVGGAGVLGAGLAVFGHDGKVATYAAMTAVCGLVLWWVGFGPWRQRTDD